VFLHSFEGTGEKAVLGLLSSHPWVKSHVGQTAATDGGCALTSAISTAVERERAARGKGMALSEVWHGVMHAILAPVAKALRKRQAYNYECHDHVE